MNSTLLGLQFDTSKYHKGIQLVLDFKKYELSVVKQKLISITGVEPVKVAT
jgi:hypothetical protein